MFIKVVDNYCNLGWDSDHVHLVLIQPITYRHTYPILGKSQPVVKIGLLSSILIFVANDTQMISLFVAQHHPPPAPPMLMVS